MTVALSLVIPVYNEEENLPLLYDAVLAAAEHFPQPW